MAASAGEIAEKLGGARTLGRRVDTMADLRHAVEAGLPSCALEAVARYLTVNEVEAQSLKRCIISRPEARRLSLEEGERTERLARLVILAEQVWEDPALAREFLTSSQPQLSGERPIDLGLTEGGAQQVEALLMKIEHALPV